ncbi:uncharacterized protein [Rutidosis leptorrhynchoides]|uniref:uncharacterized protein n=1 Tax=Rutidosis leptorrhynchoides TaxID=125765 RepID=UPI003A99B8D5
MVNVYGPNDPVKTRTLWDKLCSFIAANEGEYVCFGDFNEVRDEAERFGYIFHTEEAVVFNTFIGNTGLVNIPLNGRRFTWVNKTASKMSRIDRVLITPNVFDIFVDLKLTTLPRGYSDHLPLLLQDLKLVFWPSPFKCFNSWLLYEDFDNIVLSAAGEVMCNMELSFHEKMKHVKSKIRTWIKDKKANEKSRKVHLMERIDEIETVLETGNGTDHIVNERKDLVHELDNIQQVEDLDVLQKCRIKWDAEGDENSRYFHSPDDYIRIPQLVPDRVLSQEEVIELEKEVTENDVRSTVWACGSNKSPGPDGFNFAFVKKYWDILKEELISTVVFAFANRRMPKGAGSAFITLIPKVITKILASRLVKVMDSIICQEQFAFIAGHQILDGPFILNETMEWCKKRKEKLMIFKIDFEKAYDTVNWDFLDYMLNILGFGASWRSWVHMILQSSRTSILINGSPTKKFKVHIGLRQGDPLSPFLFLIVMEGLHLCIKEKIGEGVFHEVSVGKNPIMVSHLLYADDAIFISKWQRDKFDCMMQVLDKFHVFSGLSINVNKSVVYGLGVPESKIESFVTTVGCIKGEFPFVYLGLPMGSSMLHTSNWNSLREKFKKRLVGWQSNLLSIGGRAKLVKSVLGSVGIYYLSIFKCPEMVHNDIESMRASFFWGSSDGNRKMHWIYWDQVLAPLKNGGLGIGSTRAFNYALLLKWVWRFVANLDSKWASVIRAIYGCNGSMDGNISGSSAWPMIVKLYNKRQSDGKLPYNVLRVKVRNGRDVRFWLDNWKGDGTLASKFGRLFHLETNTDCYLADKLIHGVWIWNWVRSNIGARNEDSLQHLISHVGSCELNDNKDRWIWSLLEEMEYQVSSTRIHLDDCMLPTIDRPTRWIKEIPKKVNIFLWSVTWNR